MRFKFWQSLYADDIFISYSRRDGEAYLTGIEAALSNLGSSCFSDKLGTDAGRELPETLKERIRFCKTLVLLGTPAAVSEPKHIEIEVDTFAKVNGTARIVAIGFDKDPDLTDWSSAGWARNARVELPMTDRDLHSNGMKLDEYRAHPFYGALLRDFRWHCGQPPAVRAAFVRAMGIEP